MLEIQGKVMGDHPKNVDTNEYIKLTKDALCDCMADGKLLLQVRGVKIARWRREPGIYAVAYDTDVKNTIEVLLFGKNEAAGRPGTLVTYDQSTMGAVLEYLSPRLFKSWQGPIKQSSEIESLLNQAESRHSPNRISPQKPVKPAFGRSNDELKYIVRNVRSWLKNNLGTVAMVLACLERDLGELSIEMILKNSTEKGLSNGSCYGSDILNVFVQFGLIEVISKIKIKATNYCVMLANEALEAENNRVKSAWQKRRDELDDRRGKVEGRISELNKQIEQKQIELENLGHQLVGHSQETPKLAKYFDFAPTE